MKKLHLHKIFHWLYAVLMFLPFISTLLSVVVNWGSGNSGFSPEEIAFSMVTTGTNVAADSGTIGVAISNVFDYLFGNLFGFTDSDSLFVYFSGLFTYWVVISVGYLVFDVLMYIINVAHHWLDAGGDKL